MEIDIKSDLKEYISIFRKAYEQEMTESDTSLRVSKFLENVLKYDLFTEVSREHRIKSRYVDYAIKVDDKVHFFIEVKQASLALKERHVEQAGNYAANAGVHWILLTNGKNWNMYHLTFDEGIQISLVWSINILEGDIKDSIEKLSMLHRKNIKKGILKDYFNKRQALSPKMIIQSIFHEDILHTICLHLKKSSGIKVDIEELAESIKDMVSKETWETIGGIKIIKKTQNPKPSKQPNEDQVKETINQGENVLAID